MNRTPSCSLQYIGSFTQVLKRKNKPKIIFLEKRNQRYILKWLKKISNIHIPERSKRKEKQRKMWKTSFCCLSMTGQL